MNDINKISNIETNIDTKNMKSVLETRRPININVIKDKNIVNTTNYIIKESESSKYIPKYGWIPDTPDYRDYLYSDISKKIEEEKLAESIKVVHDTAPSPTLVVDLRVTDSPIFNQGDLNSCTSNALVGMLQFLEKKDNIPYIELSRLFIYYDERVAENTVNVDLGAQLRDGIKTLAKLGVCSENCWPYDISKFAIQPNHKCYKEAASHRILSYYRLNTFGDMIHCLNDGYPFVFGFSIYTNFESEDVVKTGVVNMPAADESLLGGHAVACVGYDDNIKRFICRNSWGVNWGDKGYFTIPFDYLTNRNLSDDIWTIRRGMNL